MLIVTATVLQAPPATTTHSLSELIEAPFKSAHVITPRRDKGLDRVCKMLIADPNRGDIRKRVRALGVYEGVMIPIVVDGIHQQKIRQDLKGYVQQNLTKQGLTRYGLAQQGQRIVLLFVRRMLTLRSLPVPARPGQMIPIYGAIKPGFSSPRILVARPDGYIDTLRADVKRGTLASMVPFYGPGRYAVEVTARGPRGNEVLALIHTQLGGRSHTHPFVPRTRTQGPRQAERLLLQWINQARARLGIPKLTMSPALEATARQHARAMATMRVAAHVLPGGHDARYRLARAGVRTKRFFENVALATTAEQAHRELWESPSHRQAILDPKITQAGIGVVAVRSDVGHSLFICEHLAKR